VHNFCPPGGPDIFHLGANRVYPMDQPLGDPIGKSPVKKTAKMTTSPYHHMTQSEKAAVAHFVHFHLTIYTDNNYW
jgi:hypothetical protein